MTPPRDPLEILSAFFDGEPVPPEELDAALSRPDAAEALRDWLRLRAGTRQLFEARPTEAWRQAMEQTLGPGPWWSRGVELPWAALAALLAGVMLLAGWALTRGEPFPAQPPEPDRVVQLEELRP